MLRTSLSHIQPDHCVHFKEVSQEGSLRVRHLYFLFVLCSYHIFVKKSRDNIARLLFPNCDVNSGYQLGMRSEELQPNQRLSPDETLKKTLIN